jgi:hypothetical protein
MPKKDKKDAPLPEAPAAAPAAETFDMVFHSQLAHGSPTKQVRDFTNVKQLYESIAKAFGIATNEILYCTLNTHKIDMNRLLGGQIGLDDFLFAHVKGATKTVKVSKDGPALGLTISDNGAGYAFIKKIREDSIMARCKNINVGDAILAINGTDLTNCRHFEVARMLKEIPIGSEFTLLNVEPKQSFEAISARGNIAAPAGDVAANAGRKTLRMKQNGTAVVEEVASSAVQGIINKIDEMLEAFVGIRDLELSTTMYDLAKESDDPSLFAGKLDEKLSDFEFPDDFVLDVHELVRPDKK